MKNNMIKVIAFDYGGVVKINEQNLIREISKYLNVSEEDYLRESLKHNHLFNIEGKSFRESVLFVVSKFDDSDITKEHILKLLEENHNKYFLNEELINIIKKLKSKEFKIGLVSNNSLSLRQKLIEDNILDLFDEVIISAEVKHQKPEPEIFEILFKKLDVKPEEVVFVDDRIEYLEKADQIGYIPILFKNNSTLKKELSEILGEEM